MTRNCYLLSSSKIFLKSNHHYNIRYLPTIVGHCRAQINFETAYWITKQIIPTYIN